MYKGNTISVVIPAYNEAGFIGEVLESVPSYVDRVYVVDDGSTDSTWEEIQAHATVAETADGSVVQFDQRIVPIRHVENRGVGGAIKTGYLRARDDEIDITAVMGGDGQMDPDRLPDLLDPIVDGRADYVKANRLSRPENRRTMPPFRYIGNVILTFLTKIASGYWGVSDPQNGYTAISLDALERAPIEDMYEFYGYCNDLLAKLNAERLRVADVPVRSVYGDEESHIRYRTYIPRVSAMLLRTFLWRLSATARRDRDNPVPLFYLTGAAGVLVGVSQFVRNLFVSRGDEADSGRALTGVLVGSVSLLVAMLWETRLNRDLSVTEDTGWNEREDRSDD